MKARTWNSLGELDPLWAILNDPAKRHGGWDPAEFLATGEQEIARALEACAALELPYERGLALDFGCGAGRLTRALASRFQQAIGIDASIKMVELAQRMNRDVANCDFRVNESRTLPLAEDSVDFVYSVLVLQHLGTDKEILSWIAEFVRVLKPGGLAVFQLPHRYRWRRRLQARNRLFAILSRLGVGESKLHIMGLAPITMRGLNPISVRNQVKASGSTIALELPDWHAGPDDSGTVYFVHKERPADRPI